MQLDLFLQLHCSFNILSPLTNHVTFQWNKAKKDKTEAPTKEPTAAAAEAPLLGPGAGAGTSVAANAALMEAAAMRTAQVTFFMSMMDSEFFFWIYKWRDPLGLWRKKLFYLLFIFFFFCCRSEEDWGVGKGYIGQGLELFGVRDYFFWL